MMYYHNYIPYHPQKRVFNGVHFYQVLLFVHLEKVVLFSYRLTYVLRILGVIRICEIKIIYRFFCGKENSSVLQASRSLCSMDASDSLVLFLLKPRAYEHSIMGLLKCSQHPSTLSKIYTFASPLLSKDIFSCIDKFNVAWDSIVIKLISFVESDSISVDAWSLQSKQNFKMRLTNRLKDTINEDYFIAVRKATFRLCQMNRVSDFSLLH